jgi:hypothetical protein
MRKKNLRFAPLFLIILVLCFNFTTKIYSQGKIIGHVKDKSTGNALVGVNVHLIDTYIGAATDLEGDYVIVNVPVGTYSIQASLIGYGNVTKTEVVVSQDLTSTVNFELEETTIVGGEVVVVAERHHLHKEVASSQIVVTNDQIVEAAGVRSLKDFLQTQASITGDEYLNIRGGNPQETGTLINGMAFVNTRVGMTESFLPTSGIEQVSVKTGGMSAEYGEFRSGLIEVSTKFGNQNSYSGRIRVTRDLAHQKRFGRSLYDPMNNYLRPHLDPDIAFIGVSAAVDQGIITQYEANQFQYSTFAGHIANSNERRLPAGWRQSLKPGEVITPVDLYLFDAWMHMAQVDFTKLNSKIRELNNQGLNVGSEITDQRQIDLFKEHSNSEDQYADFYIDAGFGGPVPFIGKYLGNATFYLSNLTNRTSYIQPMFRDYDLHTNTLLAIKSDITEGIKLKLTGAYNFNHGMNAARGADSEVPNLGTAIGGISGLGEGLDRGNLMPENNLDFFTNSGSNYGYIYWWYPSVLQDWEQTNVLTGATLTHAISPQTYYEVVLSYQDTEDRIVPKQTRNMNVLTHIGPIPVNEMPYGRQLWDISQTTYDLDGWTFDQFYSIPGLAERFDSKGGELHDNSSTKQLRLKVNFGSQFDKMNFVKAGFEYFYMDLNNKRWSIWRPQGSESMYEYNFRVFPYTIGAYAQDELTFENMIATIGLRMDYFSSGDLLWPTGRPFDGAALGEFTPPDNYIEILESGGSLVWDHWNSVNQQLIAAGEQPLLEPVKSHLVFSPRFGISFPISDDAKFYFNYGHFRSLPPYSELYMYDVRGAGGKGGLYQLGIDYLFLENYLLHVAGFYKDISGEVRSVNILPDNFLQYRYRTDDRYRDIEGLDLGITKNVGDFITGWVNLKYIFPSGGNTGRQSIYENPDLNQSPDAFYYANPSRPQPVPEIFANITFRTPQSWGYFGQDWLLSFLPHWKQGDQFSWNPANVSGTTRYFNWPDYFSMNLKLSKKFELNLVNVTLYMDINNLFNNKQFLYQYAFADWGTSPTAGSDFEDYMSSLHLPDYADPYYDSVRDEKNGKYIAGNDKIGDLRSKDKPYINDPNNDIFLFGNARAIWFGIMLDF